MGASAATARLGRCAALNSSVWLQEMAAPDVFLPAWGNNAVMTVVASSPADLVVLASSAHRILRASIVYRNAMAAYVATTVVAVNVVSAEPAKIARTWVFVLRPAAAPIALANNVAATVAGGNAVFARMDSPAVQRANA